MGVGSGWGGVGAVPRVRGAVLPRGDAAVVTQVPRGTCHNPARGLMLMMEMMVMMMKMVMVMVMIMVTVVLMMMVMMMLTILLFVARA